MFPIVVIALSDPASPQATEWVVAACSHAIAAGACVAEGTPSSEPPLAVAIVQLQAKRNRIHLEVGRRDDQQTTWRTRDLQFHTHDPEPERWRTVGLTIATLVGEIVSPSEVAELERENPFDTDSGAPTPATAPATSSPPTSTPATAPATSSPPTSAPAAAPTTTSTPTTAPAASKAPAVTARVAEEPTLALPDVPQPSSGGFIGLAFVAGPALTDFGLRWGGATRVGWVTEGGWQLALSGSYSRHEADNATASWLHLGLGVGRRFALSPSWGASISGGVGARRVAFQAAAGNRSGSLQAWNPFVAASGELWYHLGRGLSFWAALDVTGLDVETRMLVSGTERFALPRIDTVGLLGFRWMP